MKIEGISKKRKSYQLIFGQVGVRMSTSFPENMSIKLLLRLKIERFEISEREKKLFFSRS